MAKATETRLRADTPRRRLLSIKDAGVYLGRSAWTVAEMVRTGKLPYVPDGKRKYLDLFDLNKYIESNKVTALQ